MVSGEGPQRLENDVAKLTYAARKDLKKSEFAEPGKRAYPIPDKLHARNVLSRVSQCGSPSEKEKVRSAVHRKFPSTGKNQSRSVGGVPLSSLVR